MKYVIKILSMLDIKVRNKKANGIIKLLSVIAAVLAAVAEFSSALPFIGDAVQATLVAVAVFGISIINNAVDFLDDQKMNESTKGADVERKKK